jgi:UDP-N-acetylmuramoyl-tripeptide--D-alanyl-D-alanine ligase
MKLSAREIVSFTGGSLISGSPDSLVEAVSIDSRTLVRGDLFIAIEGPRHDGHHHVVKALEAGAAGLVVSRPVDAGADSVGDIGSPAFQVRVDDTTRALQDLAMHARARAEARVVAITGSMGKTTTKDAATAAIGTRHRVLKTQGNLNNLYGLPLSLLRLTDEEVAVVEMGMSERGEIARLTEIAQPDVGVLTNVAEVHLEFFASVSEIAEAKGELLLGLAAGAIAVVNADDPLVLEQARKFSGRKIRFGLAESSDVRAHEIRSSSDGIRFRAAEGNRSVEVESSLHGRHNVYNLLAGLAAARALDVPLEAAALGLTSLMPSRHRGERISLPGSILLIDETYNSNPKALVCALDALAEELGARRIAVVGDMLELGATATQLHREAGRHAAALELDLLVGVGGFGREIVEGARLAGLASDGTLTCDDADDAGARLAPRLREGDVVLVKGSRGVGLDRTVEFLRRALTGEKT